MTDIKYTVFGHERGTWGVSLELILEGHIIASLTIANAGAMPLKAWRGLSMGEKFMTERGLGIHTQGNDVSAWYQPGEDIDSQAVIHFSTAAFQATVKKVIQHAQELGFPFAE